VAIEASARSRQKILDGLSALEALKTPAQAIEAIGNGCPTSPSQFIDWLKIGSSTLYKTHSDLLESVKGQTANLGRLAREGQSRREKEAEAEKGSKDAELQQLRDKERYYKDMISLLAGEILLAGKHWELERDRRLHVERLYEKDTGRGLPRTKAVDIDLSQGEEKTDHRPLEDKITDIAAHRDRRERLIREEELSRKGRPGRNGSG
jgi:hypothetical protein